MEEDESLADTLVQDHRNDFDITEHYHTRLVGKTRFIDSLQLEGDNEEGSGDSDMGMEDSDSVEEIDIEISSGNVSSVDENEDLSESLSQPIQRRLPSHSHTTKSIKTKSRGSTKSQRTKHERKMEDTYDPSTCCKWPN